MGLVRGIVICVRKPSRFERDKGLEGENSVEGGNVRTINLIDVS